MTEHTAHDLDVHAILKGEGGESVAEVMESDLRDACPLQHTLQHVVDAVRRDRTAVRGTSIGYSVTLTAMSRNIS